MLSGAQVTCLGLVSHTTIAIEWIRSTTDESIVVSALSTLAGGELKLEGVVVVFSGVVGTRGATIRRDSAAFCTGGSW